MMIPAVIPEAKLDIHQLYPFCEFVVLSEGDNELKIRLCKYDGKYYPGVQIRDNTVTPVVRWGFTPYYRDRVAYSSVENACTAVVIMADETGKSAFVKRCLKVVDEHFSVGAKKRNKVVVHPAFLV